MCRLVVFTVFIFSSTTTACYKQVQIDNKLNSRKSSSICLIILLKSYLNTTGYILSITIYIRAPFRIAVNVSLTLPFLHFTHRHLNGTVEKASVWRHDRGAWVIDRYRRRTFVLPGQSGALSLVEIVQLLCSHWLNFNVLAPRSMP